MEKHWLNLKFVFKQSIPFLKGFGLDIKNQSEIIKNSAYKGELMYTNEIKKNIEETMKKNILEKALRYGEECEIALEIEMVEEEVKIIDLKITGIFPSAQGVGFLKNEIIKDYGYKEVEIIEKE